MSHPTQGTLALVGSGEYLARMEPVDRLLLERTPSAPRVVCLPTAAGTEGRERINYWSRLGVEHFTRLGVTVEAVEVIDRASANDEACAARIRAANFVYLSGGRPDHLLKTFPDTPVWAAILGVLEQGGVVAGCSAGAMIFGEQVFAFPGLQTGFNHLPGVLIAPHFDEISPTFAGTARWILRRELTLVGIDGYTALIVSNNHWRVAGLGGVTVWTKDKKMRYDDGQEIKDEGLGMKVRED